MKKPLPVFIVFLFCSVSCITPEPEVPSSDLLKTPLQDLLKDWRPMQGRMSGGYHHRAYLPHKNPDFRNERRFRLAELQSNAKQAYDSDDNPQTLGLLAQAKMIRGLEQDAIPDFEAAVARSPDSVDLMNDLAVACLEASEEEPMLLLRALEVIDKVVSMPDAPPEAQFNRALILQRLRLATAAEDAWNQILAQPDTWAPEAREHLEALQSKAPWEGQIERLEDAVRNSDQASVSKLVSLYPTQTREYALWTILPAWADAVVEGEESDGFLDVAEAIGNARMDLGDKLLQATVAALRASKDRDALARGVLELAIGSRHCEDRKYEDAAPYVDRAVSLLGSNPLQNWAGYYRALVVYMSGNESSVREETVRILEALEPACISKGASALLARAFTLKGQCRHNNLLKGFVETSEAVEYATEAGEELLLFGAMKNLASFLDALGDEEESVKTYMASLDLLPERPTSGHLAYGGIGHYYSEKGNAALAQMFFDEAISYASRYGSDGAVSAAYRWRGRNYADLNEMEPALRDLEQARISGEKAGKGSRKDIQAEISLVRGRLLAFDDPEQAIEELSKAYTYYREAKSRVDKVLLWRSRAYNAMGLIDKAKEDLREGIDAVESIRSKSQGYRISFLDQSLILYNEMIELLLEEEGGAQALLFTERARSRFLLDHITPKTIMLPVTTVDDVQQAIPEDAAILSFFLMEGRMAVWLLDSQNSNFRWHDLDRKALNKDLGLLANAWGTNGMPPQELKRVFSRLYDLVLAPFADVFQDKETLILLPDKELWSVPFPALMHQGRYLVEDHMTALIPSLSHFVFATERARDLEEHPHSLLAVGNPAFDALRFDYVNLVWAEEEVAVLAREHLTREPLTGSGATPAAFLARARDASVIHLALHAAINRSRPLQSKILLAAGDGDGGVLTAGELYNQEFDRTRLVVLAACEAGSPGLSASERGGDLARPFLAAGVPSVIASLRQIDDRENVDFALRLHQFIRQGKSPARALALTQRAMLESGENTSWPHFRVFGLP